MEVKEITEQEKENILKYKSYFSHLKDTMIQDLINNKNESVIYRKYPKREVLSMLEEPQRNERKIRELSNYLYLVSSHYRRLVDYFSSILLYNYTVIPRKLPQKINKKEYKNIYTYVVNECDKYNLAHEASKIIKIVIRDGVFFGLPYETDDSFYIKPVSADYAEVSSIIDGCYKFKFDLDYFNGKKEILAMYGTEFINAYEKYKGNREKGIKPDKNKRWYEPKNCICIKADESDPIYSFPVFSGLFASIYDIEDYKLLQKAKKENDNFKALSLLLPTDERGVPLADFEEYVPYFNHIVDNVGNSGIGVFMTPFKVDDYSFATTSTSEKNDVIETEEEFWMSSGVSSLIFGSAKATSSSSLQLSVKTDEQIAFCILRQIERYFNMKLKNMDLKYLFKISFTAQSIFNSSEYTDKYFKASQYGVCSKLQYASSLGISQSDVEGLTFLEEDILGFGKKKWSTPLVSSNTQSNKDSEGGRPTNESQGKGLSETGEQTKEDGENENK